MPPQLPAEQAQAVALHRQAMMRMPAEQPRTELPRAEPAARAELQRAGAGGASGAAAENRASGAAHAIEPRVRGPDRRIAAQPPRRARLEGHQGLREGLRERLRKGGCGRGCGRSCGSRRGASDDSDAPPNRRRSTTTNSRSLRGRTRLGKRCTTATGTRRRTARIPRRDAAFVDARVEVLDENFVCGEVR